MLIEDNIAGVHYSLLADNEYAVDGGQVVHSAQEVDGYGLDGRLVAFVHM